MTEKIQTGLRIPQTRYEELTALSAEIGISLNALALMLIDLGLKAVNLGAKEAAHCVPHSLQHTGE